MTTSDQHGLCTPNTVTTIASYETVCNVSNNDSQCIEKATICGNCVADDYRGVGMIINVPSFTCIECDDVSGVSIFLTEIMLVMITMVLLAVLHINITNGNLNAYILYSQIVTLQFPGLGYTAWTPFSNPFFLSS